MPLIPFGRLWALVGIAALATATRDVRPPAAPPHPPNGIAIAYAQGPFARDFSVAATLTLQRSPTNRSWYCDWLMLVASRGGPEQPMVQAGLMRWARNGYRLSAFFAQGYEDQRGIHYEDLSVLPEGPHRIELRAHRAQLYVFVDGRELRTVALANVFRPQEQVYAQMAGEVYEPGDAIAGSLERIAIARDGAPRPQPYDGRCQRYDRGLRLDGPADKLTVHGRFDLAQPSNFVGCGYLFIRNAST
jgi:hypothetical protein